MAFQVLQAENCKCKPQSCGTVGGRVEHLGTSVQKIKQLPCQCQNNGKEAREGRVGEKAKAVACATQQEKALDAVEQKLKWRPPSPEQVSDLFHWSTME